MDVEAFLQFFPLALRERLPRGLRERQTRVVEGAVLAGEVAGLEELQRRHVRVVETRGRRRRRLLLCGLGLGRARLEERLAVGRVDLRARGPARRDDSERTLDESATREPRTTRREPREFVDGSRRRRGRDVDIPRRPSRNPRVVTFLDDFRSVETTLDKFFAASKTTGRNLLKGQHATPSPDELQIAAREDVGVADDVARAEHLAPQRDVLRRRRKAAGGRSRRARRERPEALGPFPRSADHAHARRFPRPDDAGRGLERDLAVPAFRRPDREHR